jgi:hypothetical protein
MEKCYEIAHRFRFGLLLLTLTLWCVGAFAFWPPDLVPHPRPIEDEDEEEPKYAMEHYDSVSTYYKIT